MLRILKIYGRCRRWLVLSCTSLLAHHETDLARTRPTRLLINYNEPVTATTAELMATPGRHEMLMDAERLLTRARERGKHAKVIMAAVEHIIRVEWSIAV